MSPTQLSVPLKSHFEDGGDTLRYVETPLELLFFFFFPEYDLSVRVNSGAIFRHAHISLWMGSYSFGKGGYGGN